MKTNRQRLAAYLPMVLLALLTPGCATQALWQHTAAHEWKPARPMQVLVSQDTNRQPDVVIIFPQVEDCGATNRSRTVGWNVRQPPGQLALTPKAIRQLTNACANLQSVRVFAAEYCDDDLAMPAGFAVWNQTNAQITLHLQGRTPEPFTLPGSSQKQNLALRAGVLPLAIIADAATVGLATAFVLTFLVCAGH